MGEGAAGGRRGGVLFLLPCRDMMGEGQGEREGRERVRQGEQKTARMEESKDTGQW
jgi:hypothetical protein